MTDAPEAAPGPGRVVPWAEGQRLVAGLRRLETALRLYRWTAVLSLFILLPALTGGSFAVFILGTTAAMLGTHLLLWLAGLQTLSRAIRHPMTRRFLRLAQVFVFAPFLGLLALLDGSPSRGAACAGLLLVVLHPASFYVTLLALLHAARFMGMLTSVENARSNLLLLLTVHVVVLGLFALATFDATDWPVTGYIAFAGLLLFFSHIIPAGRLRRTVIDLRWAIEMGYGRETSWRRKRKRAERH